MPLSPTTRLGIYEDMIDTLKAIQAGDDYYLNVQKVTTSPLPIEQTDSKQWPMWIVLGGVGSEGVKGASNRHPSLVSITCIGYVGPDETRWGDLTAAQLAERMIADATKALNVDRSRGIPSLVWAPEDGYRDTDVLHDPEGRFSVVLLTDTYAYITER